MGDANRNPLTTSAADLVTAIDATLARCFGGLDEADEARKLGLPEAALRALRERLEALRDLAAKAAAPPEGAPGEGAAAAGRPDPQAGA